MRAILLLVFGVLLCVLSAAAQQPTVTAVATVKQLCGSIITASSDPLCQ